MAVDWQWVNYSKPWSLADSGVIQFNAFVPAGWNLQRIITSGGCAPTGTVTGSASPTAFPVFATMVVQIYRETVGGALEDLVTRGELCPSYENYTASLTISVPVISWSVPFGIWEWDAQVRASSPTGSTYVHFSFGTPPTHFPIDPDEATPDHREGTQLVRLLLSKPL